MYLDDDNKKDEKKVVLQPPASTLLFLCCWILSLRLMPDQLYYIANRICQSSMTNASCRKLFDNTGHTFSSFFF